MSTNRNKYLISQSLLSAWLWSYKKEDGYEDFLKTLHKQGIQQTKQMLAGVQFENILNAVLTGAEIDATHEWYKPITELQSELQGAQQQVRLYRDIKVEGIDFLAYGVLDYLKAGIVYDTKYSKAYDVGKYLTSPQHSMYLYLVPEARRFDYKICDGEWIYTESYYPDQVEPIEHIIKNFMGFLDRQNLVDTYCEIWKAKT
jgi:hypothetical protein